MPQRGPMSFDACMARDWPGVDDKPAFCAVMCRGDLNKVIADHMAKAGYDKAGGDTDAAAFRLHLPIAKRDAKQQVITGWAALSRDGDGNPVVDYQGDYIPITDLEKAAHEFMVDGGSGKGGEMHEHRIGDVVESMVVDADKREALGFGPGPEGWAVSIKIHDPSTWAKVMSGELKELSISGAGERVPIGAVDA